MSDVEMPRKQVPPPLELVKKRIEEVLPPEAKAEIDQGEVAVIDTRDPDRFEQGHLRGAVNVPAGENGVDSHAEEFAQRVAEAAGEKSALLYCNSGNRSARAADALTNEHGEKGVRSMVGGIKLWSDLGYEIEGSVAPDEDDTTKDEDGEG
jgi:rhodanese-related sulfurtransferase